MAEDARLAAKKRKRCRSWILVTGHRGHGVRPPRKQETDGCGPRNIRKTRTDFTGGNGENGGRFFIRAIRVIRGERIRKVGREKAQGAQETESDCVTEVTELGHRGGGRLKANTAKCRERSGDPRNPRETLSGLLREMFLPRKSAYPKRPIRKGRKILRAGKVCRLGGRRGAQRRGHPSDLSTGSPRPRSSDGQATSGRRGHPSVLPGRGPWRRAEGTRA